MAQGCAQIQSTPPPMIPEAWPCRAQGQRTTRPFGEGYCRLDLGCFGRWRDLAVADIVVAFELEVVAAEVAGRGRCIVEEPVGIAAMEEVARRRHCYSSGLNSCIAAGRSDSSAVHCCLCEHD